MSAEEVNLKAIEEKVIDIICEQMGADKSEVTRETSFINDLNADSLDRQQRLPAEIRHPCRERLRLWGWPPVRDTIRLLPSAGCLRSGRRRASSPLAEHVKHIAWSPSM